MSRKITALLLAIIMCFDLTGCKHVPKDVCLNYLENISKYDLKTDVSKVCKIIQIFQNKIEEEKEKESNFICEDDGNGGLVLMGYTGDDETIVIPDLIDGKPVHKITNDAFSGACCIRSIKLSDTITSIDEFAFAHNKTLETIIMGNGVLEIGAFAFAGCENLTDVSLSDNLLIINSLAFSRCYSLQNILLPETIEEIDTMAFHGLADDFIMLGSNDVASDYANNESLSFMKISEEK